MSPTRSTCRSSRRWRRATARRRRRRWTPTWGARRAGWSGRWPRPKTGASSIEDGARGAGAVGSATRTVGWTARGRAPMGGGDEGGGDGGARADRGGGAAGAGSGAGRGAAGGGAGGDLRLGSAPVPRQSSVRDVSAGAGARDRGNGARVRRGGG